MSAGYSRCRGLRTVLDLAPVSIPIWLGLFICGPGSLPSTGARAPEPMTKVNRASPPEPSHELISKLIKAGYLQPAHQHDADAITKAIARLSEALGGGGEDEGPAAA